MATTLSDSSLTFASHAEFPHYDFARLLLDHGANLEATNQNKETAWLLAAMANQLEIVEIFKAHRAAREKEKR